MSSYFFGDASTTAQIYLDQMASVGPAIEAGLDRIEELEPQQAKDLLAKLYCVCARAHREGVSEDVWAVLVEKYDKAFVHVLTVDNDLQDALFLNKHQYLGGQTTENVVKYKRLAGILV